MTAAVVALALALAAASGGLIALGAIAVVGARRAGDEKARADALSVRLEALAVRHTELATQLEHEKERADALDDLLAEYAAAGPVAGAYERLLSTWSTRRTRGDAARALPAPEPAKGPGPDDLLRPGE